MKTIIFNNDITESSVTNIITKIESYIPTDLINIYFTAGNGDIPYKNVLVNYINDTSSVVNYNIMAFNSLSGLGFECFFKFRAYLKDILPGTVGVFSKYDKLEAVTKESKLYASEINKSNKDLIEWYKLTNPKQQQLRDFNAGRIVCYDYTELQTILTNYRDVLAPPI